MIIPSIDLAGGQAVQLVGGETLAIEAGCPFEVAQTFGKVGPMAVIDLDAALGRGDNSAQIETLCREYRCRVGGGIRSIERARHWLDAGAEQIIIGTAATREFLSQLPRERLLVALDARDGEVVVDGWREKTGRTVLERIAELKDLVSGFLVTFVECEGRMQGTRMEQVESLVASAGSARVTVAGGVSTAAEIKSLDMLGADAQVGMALYSGRLDLAEAFTAPMSTDRADGLWPTVVVDEFDRALGFVYSNLESVQAALKTGRGVYWSRKRGLWRKGESSGAIQELLGVDIDCDRDALRFKVKQRGPGFCHLSQTSCWGPLKGLPALEQTILERQASPCAGSYTDRLMNNADLLRAKLLEEAGELMDARDSAEAEWEMADLLYFASVRLSQAGGRLEGTIRELVRRSLKLSRRPGDAKRAVGAG